MTRENKLALIVGFGLILLVGILISDYFSEAQRPDQAQLGGVVDPLSNRKESDDLIQFMAPKENELLPRKDNQMVSNQGTYDFGNGPSGRTARLDDGPREQNRGDSGNSGGSNGGAIEMGGSNGGHDLRSGLGEHSSENTPARSWKNHHVRSNETLTSICKDYLGTGDYAVVLKLAQYNDLDNPDALREGRRLRIPGSVEALDRALASGDPDDDFQPVNTSGNDRDSKRTPPTRTYTVRDNDTLSEIASREMGSAKYWKKLYDANSDVIKNPDRLIPGTVIDIPSV